MVNDGVDKNYASKLIQNGWEVITEQLKHGGLTKMMDMISDAAKLRVSELSEELKDIMVPLYNKHMEEIMSGEFSKKMMLDWDKDDYDLLKWREETGQTMFEKTSSIQKDISVQEYFDHGTAMIAFIKAGVELSFETMTNHGIKDASAYYESLHELPLIANLVSRKKLYEMNRIISDTAEYGCYLFSNACMPLLKNIVDNYERELIGIKFNSSRIDIDQLKKINSETANHPVEVIGSMLRSSMTEMKNLF